MIHIIVATFKEAKFFIDELKLKKLNSAKEFQIFFGGEFTLTISGMGKLNSAMSVTTTYFEFGGKKNNCWVNVGLAGHKAHKIGELFIINKIVDKQNNNYYPYSPTLKSVKCISCTTYDKPDFSYSDSISDMELSGFYHACNKYSYRELIHSLKIISDNRSETINFKNEKQIFELFKAKREIFFCFFKKIEEIWNYYIREDFDFNEKINRLIKNIKATKTERQQIRNMTKLIYLKTNNISENLFLNNNPKKIISDLKRICDYEN